MRVHFWMAAAMAAPYLLSPPAQAQTFDVKQLEIKAGELELGLDNTVHFGLPRPADGINRSVHEVSLDYGMRGWWRLSGVGKFENPAEEAARLNAIAIENIFVLRGIDDKATHDVGLGAFLAVEAGVHNQATNVLTWGPVLALKADKLSFVANPFFEKTFGRNHTDGIALNYGWQLKYDLGKGFALGIEGFGVVENLGHAPPADEQEHRIGPVAYFEIEVAKGVAITPDVGVLFGLTRATPDVALKLNVGVPLYKRPEK